MMRKYENIAFSIDLNIFLWQAICEKSNICVKLEDNINSEAV